MARNLQSKLPPNDTVRVFDINKAAADKLVHTMQTQQAGGAAATVASSAGDAAREAVCTASRLPSTSCCVQTSMMSLFPSMTF
jgi:3-hydroxyisobutyrate dehydrogenase